MSDLISFVWSDDLEVTCRKRIYLRKRQSANRGLFIDPWIQMMTFHILGARWLRRWPHADLRVAEPSVSRHQERH